MSKRAQTSSYDDDDFWWLTGPRTMEIDEDDDAFRPRPTGVLNASGQMIYREPERIGFRLRAGRQA